MSDIQYPSKRYTVTFKEMDVTVDFFKDSDDEVICDVGRFCARYGYTMVSIVDFFEPTRVVKVATQEE